MDHKVSKDMISSGMIPSGEKTQADLSRTQYGSAPSPSKLMDAYKSMYDKKEEVINEHHKKDADGNTIPHEGEELNEGKIPAGLQAYLDKKKGKKEDKKDVKEFIERVKGMPPTNEMGKVMVGQEAKDYYKAQKSKRKPFEPVKPKRKPFEPVAEENKDLHEVGFLAALGKIGAGAAKAGAAAGKAGAAAGKTGAMAAKAGSGAAKVTASGGKVVQGGGPTSLMGKAKKFVKDNPLTSYSIARDMTSGGGGSAAGQTKTSSISASADLFDIVKGKLLDEGLSEEEIKDIMLTLTPDEILKEIEESSMSAGSSGGHYSDGGDGVFRSKQQVANQFNKNIPAAKNGKVDKSTRKAINTSARDFGIQGPTTLKQSVEPEGETI